MLTKAEYIISAATTRQFPPGDLPEVAFVGRSNVGKSSLINNLVRRKNLARVSQTPGKTQLINFYLINDSFYLVDLPGYGFARVQQAVKVRWANLIDNYLRNRKTLIGVVQLVDLRHPPTSDDQKMIYWLRENQLPIIVAATKADKLSRWRRQQQEKSLASALGLPPEVPFLSYSIKTGEGRDELLGLLGGWLLPYKREVKNNEK